MSKISKSTKINFGIVPIFVVLIIGGLIYLYFSGNLDFDKGPKVRRINGFPTVHVTDTEFEKQRLVIKTQEELDNFLNFIDPSGYIVLREKIDFNREWLLAVTTSSHKETGHSIKIRKLYKNDKEKKLLVSVQESELGDTCEKQPQGNLAIDIVAINKTDLKITFEKVKKVEECK